ncbi:unnamed protein product [Prorocentrum cordatum]|uniref:Bidirectional sugar transporter SWEET n=2 Tax=Prorocentrum cordatum TaxID=2364126 RepID=A0ABN9UBK1_9DINO|nr:unnamed protein product [Polarella glacialis]
MLLPSCFQMGAIPQHAFLASAKWFAEDVVRIGPLSLGAPALTALILLLSPMVEVVPRIRRQQNVGRLPMLPYTAMTCGGIFWSVYAVIKGITPVLIVNTVQWGLPIILGTYYCWVFGRYCPEAADWLPWTLKAHLRALALAPVACATVLAACSRRVLLLLGLCGNLANILMFAGPLAAVGTVIRERSTRALPLGFTCVVVVNGGLWTAYAALLLGDYMVLVPNLIGFLLGLVQLSLFLRYGVDRGAAPGQDAAGHAGSPPACSEADDEDGARSRARARLAHTAQIECKSSIRRKRGGGQVLCGVSWALLGALQRPRVPHGGHVRRHLGRLGDVGKERYRDAPVQRVWSLAARGRTAVQPLPQRASR